MLKEVRFRFRHNGCWLQETTERYPDITLVVSSIYMLGNDVHVDLMVHAPKTTTVVRAHQDWEADRRIAKVTKIYEGPRGTRFHVAYANPDSIYPDIIQHTPVSIGAIRMAGGVEHYAIVGESEDVTRLMKTLAAEGKLEVESTRALKEMPDDGHPTSTWESLLTEKQWDAVALAAMLGYYQWPRSLTASQLASKVGLSSSAYLEHLRLAESRVLARVVDEMRQVDPARFEALRRRIKDD